MLKEATKFVLAVMLALAMGTGLTACGSDKKPSTSRAGVETSATSSGSASTPSSQSGGSEEAGHGAVVVRVGSYPITRSMVAHWMSTIGGGDFYEIGHYVAPKGIVSEPANIPVCVAALRSVTGRGSLRPSEGQLRQTCSQIHHALKLQATTYLISAYTALGEGAEKGIHLSSAQVEQGFRELQAREAEFSTEAKLQTYLAQRGWSLADELFLVKRNLTSEKLLAKLQEGSGAQGLEKAVDELSQRWLAQTACSPAYVAEGCREFSASKTPVGPSMAHIIGGLQRWRQ